MPCVRYEISRTPYYNHQHSCIISWSYKILFLLRFIALRLSTPQERASLVPPTRASKILQVLPNSVLKIILLLETNIVFFSFIILLKKNVHFHVNCYETPIHYNILRLLVSESHKGAHFYSKEFPESLTVNNISY